MNKKMKHKKCSWVAAVPLSSCAFIIFGNLQNQIMAKKKKKKMKTAQLGNLSNIAKRF